MSDRVFDAEVSGSIKVANNSRSAVITFKVMGGIGDLLTVCEEGTAFKLSLKAVQQTLPGLDRVDGPTRGKDAQSKAVVPPASSEKDNAVESKLKDEVVAHKAGKKASATETAAAVAKALGKKK